MTLEDSVSLKANMSKQFSNALWEELTKDFFFYMIPFTGFSAPKKAMDIGERIFKENTGLDINYSLFEKSLFYGAGTVVELTRCGFIAGMTYLYFNS